MLSRRLLVTQLRQGIAKPRSVSEHAANAVRSLSSTSRLSLRTDVNVLDPELNGNYRNPPAEKRALRDPYTKYWDSQERRNYGEPVHEDNDILGIFTTEKYTWTNTRWGGVLFGGFVASVLTLVGLVYVFQYPEKPAVPREFDIDEALGGKEAIR